MIGKNYIISDSRNVKKIFQVNAIEEVDCIITSPPYYGIKNYANKENQIGINQSYNEYLKDVSHILNQCYSIAKSDATLWLVLDSIKTKGYITTLPFDIAHELKNSKEQTWKFKEIIIWDKRKNTPWHSHGRLKNRFEYILFFVKGKRFKFYIDRIRELGEYKKWWKTYPERYNPRGIAPSNIWEIAIPIRGWGQKYQEHYCSFPFSLVERILLLSSDENDLVLDPFAGTGTVLAISEQMNRRSFGIDINIEYKKLFEEKVITGAKQYWEKRNKKKEKEKKREEEFKINNIKLRSIKGAFEIKNILKNLSFYNNENICVLYESNNTFLNSTSILYIIGNSNDYNLANLENNELICDIKTRFKSNYIIRNILLKDFIDKYSDTEFYLYNKKIYHYEKKISTKILYDKSTIINGVISNIKIDIK